tara:strand:+ start:235 stop:384 length:150 start_codon:yes stop_codon:yes gene_type:complete
MHYRKKMKSKGSMMAKKSAPKKMKKGVVDGMDPNANVMISDLSTSKKMM